MLPSSPSFVGESQPCANAGKHGPEVELELSFVYHGLSRGMPLMVAYAFCCGIVVDDVEFGMK